jgi:hypothetical protein
LRERRGGAGLADWAGAHRDVPLIVLLLALVTLAAGRYRARVAFASLVLLVALWAACGGIVMRIPGTPFITYSLTATGTFASGSSTLSHSVMLKLTVQ